MTRQSIRAFPDNFIAWPDHFAWAGTLLTAETPGGATQCVTADSDSPITVAMKSKPQPTDSSIYFDTLSIMTGDDLRGHDYMPVSYDQGCGDDGWHYGVSPTSFRIKPP